MTKYVIDDKKLSSEFDEAQIKRFMEELNFSRLEALLYLWGYNHFFTYALEVTEDNGRPMYRNLAVTFGEIFEVQDE